MSLFSSARSEKEREQKRFYLLPGMGGRALRRKRRTILTWSIVAGLVVSAVIAVVLYVLNSSAYR